MRISDWSSDVCSSDLALHRRAGQSAFEPGRDVAEAVGPHQLTRLVEVDQVVHPAQRRDVGYCVVVAHDPRPHREPAVEHAQQPLRFVSLALQQALVLVLLPDELVEETERSEEHTSELQPLMSNSYADF